MKTLQLPENKAELRNILIQEDLVLHLRFRDLDYELKGNGFSSDRLSIDDVVSMIVDELRDLGIVVTWNIS